MKAGTAVRARGLPAYIEVWHEGRCVARHARGYGVMENSESGNDFLYLVRESKGALLRKFAAMPALAGEDQSGRPLYGSIRHDRSFPSRHARLQ